MEQQVLGYFALIEDHIRWSGWVPNTCNPLPEEEQVELQCQGPNKPWPASVPSGENQLVSELFYCMPAISSQHNKSWPRAKFGSLLAPLCLDLGFMFERQMAFGSDTMPMPVLPRTNGIFSSILWSGNVNICQDILVVQMSIPNIWRCHSISWPGGTSVWPGPMSDIWSCEYFAGWLASVSSEDRFVRNLSDANQCILVNFCELLKHYHRRKPDLKWVTRQNLMLDRDDPLGL